MPIRSLWHRLFKESSKDGKDLGLGGTWFDARAQRMPITAAGRISSEVSAPQTGNRV